MNLEYTIRSRLTEYAYNEEDDNIHNEEGILSKHEAGNPPNDNDLKIVPVNIIRDIEDIDKGNQTITKIIEENSNDKSSTLHFDLLYHCEPDIPPEWAKMPSSHFQDQWNKIATYRMDNPTAPVDHYGCDIARGNISEIAKRWSVLVSCVISSQTKDLDNYAAMTRLINHIHPKELSAEAILGIETDVLQSILYPVSFYRNKTKYIHKIANILIENHNGDIPDKLNDVLNLPGVGPKMAHLIMKGCWNQTSGIAVDIHVFRISNRLAWVKATSPEKTMEALMNTLPKKLWNQINHLLVGFGQMMCSAINPKCHECPVNDTCPSANIRSITAKRSRDKKPKSKVKRLEESDSSPVSPKTPNKHKIITTKEMTDDPQKNTTKRQRKNNRIR